MEDEDIVIIKALSVPKTNNELCEELRLDSVTLTNSIFVKHLNDLCWWDKPLNQGPYLMSGCLPQLVSAVKQPGTKTVAIPIYLINHMAPLQISKVEREILIL